MVALILALLLIGPTATSTPGPALADTVLILNSGSTNTSSFTVAVSRDGSLDIGIHGSVTKKQVPKKLASQLFADIARAGSLTALPQGHCMKSTSFGTETTLVYDGETSPDLSCAQSNIERILAADVNAIVGAANINTHKRSSLPGTRLPL